MKMILVTGAPRSGTTPVGAALALAPGTKMIYEPMGATGDSRIPVRFAIPGQDGLPIEAFHGFLKDLSNLRLQLGTQNRRSYRHMSFVQRMLRRVIGSRTRISYLMARIGPSFTTIIWKDPLAVFAVPEVLSQGIPTVLCLRSHLAHAASFKRRNWTVDVASIYPHFRERYGAVPEIEVLLARNAKPGSVESASILWHMVYLLAFRTRRGDFGKFAAPFLIISASELETDEIGVYRSMYQSLGLPFDGMPRQTLEKRASRAVADSGGKTKVHEWRRSVSATNTYWKNTLTKEEVEFVQGLNGWIFAALDDAGAAVPQADNISAVLPVAAEARL